MKTLALVIPVYQYEKHITNTLEKLKRWKDEHTHDKIHIIFSDDGSTDKTVLILESWVQEHNDNWLIVSSKINLGKGAAVRRGITEAYRLEPDFIIFSDCDLYYGLDILFQKMIPELENFDLVVIDRSWKSDTLQISFVRRFASAIFNRFVSVLTGVTFRDTQAGLKGFRAKDCRPIFNVLTLNSYAFDVEILSIAHFFRFKIVQIPVTFSNIAKNFPSTVSLIKDSIMMVADLFRINWNWRQKRYFSSELRERVDSRIYTIRDRNI